MDFDGLCAALVPPIPATVDLAALVPPTPATVDLPRLANPVWATEVARLANPVWATEVARLANPVVAAEVARLALPPISADYLAPLRLPELPAMPGRDEFVRELAHEVVAQLLAETDEEPEKPE